MDKWKIIVEWAKLPLHQQIVTALAVVIITNLSIVFFFLDREDSSAIEHKAALKLKDERIDKIQASADAFVLYHLNYVDKKETEYQKILIELNKINDK